MFFIYHANISWKWIVNIIIVQDIGLKCTLLIIEYHKESRGNRFIFLSIITVLKIKRHPVLGILGSYPNQNGELPTLQS